MADRIKINTDANGKPVSSEITLTLTFDHPDGLTRQEVRADLQQALEDFARQYNMDIYERDADGNRTETVNQARLEQAIDDHFSHQFEMVVATRRQELAAQAVAAASKFRRPQPARRHG